MQQKNGGIILLLGLYGVWISLFCINICPQSHFLSLCLYVRCLMNAQTLLSTPVRVFFQDLLCLNWKQTLWYHTIFTTWSDILHTPQVFWITESGTKIKILQRNWPSRRSLSSKHVQKMNKLHKSHQGMPPLVSSTPLMHSVTTAHFQPTGTTLQHMFSDWKLGIVKGTEKGDGADFIILARCSKQPRS